MNVFQSPIWWQSVLMFLGGYLSAWVCASLFGVARDILVGAGSPAS